MKNKIKVHCRQFLGSKSFKARGGLEGMWDVRNLILTCG